MACSPLQRNRIIRILLVFTCFVSICVLNVRKHYSALGAKSGSGGGSVAYSQHSLQHYEVDDKLIRQRLRKSITGTFNSTNNNHTLPHLFNHIPKTAGYYSFSMLIQMVFLSDEINAIDEEFRPCNIGAGAVARRPSHWKGTKCT